MMATKATSTKSTPAEVEPGTEVVAIEPESRPTVIPLAVNFDALAKVREPFPENQVNKLPKPIKKTQQGEPRYKCEKGHPDFRNASFDGEACGGYHVKSIHLDYVGHAALTLRLLESDPTWTWEPLALGPNGLPLLDQNGGLWIKLTVGGVTRLGYGDSQGKTGGNAIKEAIGDALRNAGMRFGAALDLWHKGDLYDADEESGRLAVQAGPEATAAAAPKAAAKPRGKAAAKAPAETPAEKPQEPAGEDEPPMALSEPDPADPGHPLPPSGWEERVASAPTLQALQDIYEEAARDQWFDKLIVAPHFTKRKVTLQAQADAAASQLAQSFNQEG